MILELTYARGMRLWLDGFDASEGKDGWSIGGNGDDSGILKLSEKTGSPLIIGPYRVTGLESNVPFGETGEGHVPTTITLKLLDAAGKPEPVTLNVTEYAWGREDDGPVTVMLINNNTIEVDEITLFIRARTDAIVGEPENLNPSWVPPFALDKHFEPEPAPDCVKSYEVYADYDGNVPSCSSVMSCSSLELAEAVCKLAEAVRDDLSDYEGYEFCKKWEVAGGVARRADVVCSLAEAKRLLWDF